MGHGGAVVFEMDTPVSSRSPTDVTDSQLSAKAEMPSDGDERRKWGNTDRRASTVMRENFGRLA